MLNQNAIEILKVVASIGTPFTIALVGILINRAIQRQNAIAQRQSSWLVKWADEFLMTASQFNDSATSFIMVWVLNHVKSTNDLPGAIEEQKRLHLDCLPHWLNLQRGLWDLSKFASFAPDAGEGLRNAAEALDEEVSIWMKNKGGNVQTFRVKQVEFNAHVRKVHAELLRI